MTKYRLFPTTTPNTWRVQRKAGWFRWVDIGHYDWTKTPAKWWDFILVHSIAEGEAKIAELREKAADYEDRQRAGRKWQRAQTPREY